LLHDVSKFMREEFPPLQAVRCILTWGEANLGTERKGAGGEPNCRLMRRLVVVNTDATEIEGDL
jgi:hypothetical protein